MTRHTTVSDNARGALYMTISMSAFAIGDGVMKLVFETLPVGQSLFVRGLFASLFIVLLSWHRGVLTFRPTKEKRPAIIWRTLAEVIATGSFMLALARVDIGTATAVLQASPLAVTMAAALVLGEPVGWRRWMAIGVGFVGMLLIVRPGGDASIWLLSAVVTVFAMTLRDIVTRVMSPRVPALYASVWSALAITAASGLSTPFEGWAPLGALELVLLVVAAVLIMVGYVTITLGMRFGEISVVSPFRYSALLVAIIAGVVMFGTLPDALTLTGAFIIVGAGLYTIYREWVRGRPLTTRVPNRPDDPTPEEPPL